MHKLGEFSDLRFEMVKKNMHHEDTESTEKLFFDRVLKRGVNEISILPYKLSTTVDMSLLLTEPGFDRLKFVELPPLGTLNRLTGAVEKNLRQT